MRWAILLCLLAIASAARVDFEESSDRDIDNLVDSVLSEGQADDVSEDIDEDDSDAVNADATTLQSLREYLQRCAQNGVRPNVQGQNVEGTIAKIWSQEYKEPSILKKKFHTKLEFENWAVKIPKDKKALKKKEQALKKKKAAEKRRERRKERKTRRLKREIKREERRKRNRHPKVKVPATPKARPESVPTIRPLRAHHNLRRHRANVRNSNNNGPEYFKVVQYYRLSKKIAAGKKQCATLGKRAKQLAHIARCRKSTKEAKRAARKLLRELKKKIDDRRKKLVSLLRQRTHLNGGSSSSSKEATSSADNDDEVLRLRAKELKARNDAIAAEKRAHAAMKEAINTAKAAAQAKTGITSTDVTVDEEESKHHHHKKCPKGKKGIKCRKHHCARGKKGHVCRRVRRIVKWFKARKGRFARFRKWLSKHAKKGEHSAASRSLIKLLSKSRAVYSHKIGHHLLKSHGERHIASHYKTHIWAKDYLNKKYQESVEKDKDRKNCNWICRMRREYLQKKSAGQEDKEGKGSMISYLVDATRKRIAHLKAHIHSLEDTMTADRANNAKIPAKIEKEYRIAREKLIRAEKFLKSSLASL